MKPAYFSSIDEPSIKVLAVDSKVGGKRGFCHLEGPQDHGSHDANV